MGGIVSSIFGGGGGGSAPSTPSATSQNVTTSNIAPWAQSGVSDLINAGMGQIFQTNPDGSINTNAMKGYTPFNANTPAGNEWVQGAAGSVAGFSPLQQQAQQSIANMQTPGQYGQAMDMSTMAGLGALGTTGQAGQYGQIGQAAGLAGMQAGNAYGQNATNPNAVAAYMNPYIQNTLNPALQLQNQQFGQINAQNQGQATQQGAFGGGRQAVMQGLNQQNQDLATNQLVSNAYNQAYNTANQNMQTAGSQAMQGAGLGIQGAQAGLQGVGAQQAGYAGLGSQATNLANIAGAQTTTGLGINAAQQAAGATQQQNQQNILNQAMANYNTAQTMPMTQLAQLESMYTGAPQNITTSTYSAAPNTVSQLAGLGTAAIGASKLASAKKGGLPKEFEVKKMATGGIASGVPAPKLDALLGRLDDQQLALKADPKQNDPQTAQAAASQQAFRAQMRPAGIGQNYNFAGAGGGIVAFAAGDEVKDDSSATPSLSTYADQWQQLLGPNTAGADYLKTLQGIQGNDSKAANNQDAWRMIQGGIGLMGNKSPFFDPSGAMPAIEGHMSDVKGREQQTLALAKASFDVNNASYQDKVSMLKLAQTDKAAFDKMAYEKGIKADELANALEISLHRDETSIKTANITSAAAGAGAKFDQAAVDARYKALLGENPESVYSDAQKAQFRNQAYQDVLNAKKPYAAAMLTAETNADAAALKSLQRTVAVGATPEIRAEAQRQIDIIQKRMGARTTGAGKGGAETGGWSATINTPNQ